MQLNSGVMWEEAKTKSEILNNYRYPRLLKQELEKIRGQSGISIPTESVDMEQWLAIACLNKIIIDNKNESKAAIDSLTMILNDIESRVSSFESMRRENINTNLVILLEELTNSGKNVSLQINEFRLKTGKSRATFFRIKRKLRQKSATPMTT